MTLAPTITTKRLTLRALRKADLDALAAFMQSARSHWVGGPQNREQTWRGLLASLGHWVMFGYGSWAIEETATGQIAGRVGVINHDSWDEPELGWAVFDGCEGKGYAFEAATAARACAARNFGLNGVISYIDPANSRSVALARRLGAAYERDGQVMGRSCHVYRHPTVEVAL